MEVLFDAEFWNLEYILKKSHFYCFYIIIYFKGTYLSVFFDSFKSMHQIKKIVNIKIKGMHFASFESASF